MANLPLQTADTRPQAADGCLDIDLSAMEAGRPVDGEVEESADGTARVRREPGWRTQPAVYLVPPLRH